MIDINLTNIIRLLMTDELLYLNELYSFNSFWDS